MRITSSKFVTSVASKKNFIADGIPQVAFVGRSNVGKSSLLNMLTNRNKLAKTSSTPGRTRLVNYFLMNDSFYFVDLPGYGYAQASKTMVENWQALLAPYLTNNQNLKCVCVLVDSRHKPSELDEIMITYLSHYAIPFVIVATKTDKLVKSQVKLQMQMLASELKVGISNIVPTSSESRVGQEELLNKIESLLAVHHNETQD